MSDIFKGVKDQVEIHVVAEMEQDTDDRGKPVVVRVPFWVTVRRLSRSKAKELYQILIDDDDDLVTDSEVEHLVEHVLGWRGLKDKNGEELPFSPETLREALEVREYYQAIANAFNTAQIGARQLKAARRKN